MSPQYYEIGPGFWAFVVTFGLALTVWLLSRSLTRKVRKQKLEERRRGAASVSAATEHHPAPLLPPQAPDIVLQGESGSEPDAPRS